MTARFAISRPGAKSRHLTPRLLLWSLIVGALAGVLGLGVPFDDMLRIVRTLPRSHAASGRIVIAGIDDATLADLQSWPISRATEAQVVDGLFRLGAQRVFLDLDVSTPSGPAEDAMFEAVAARYGKRLVLPASFYRDTMTGVQTDRLPLARFQRHVDTATVTYPFDRWGTVWKLPYAEPVAGTIFPSFAAKLAGVEGPSSGPFPVDYAIDPRSIPVVSVIDVLRGKVPRSAVAGRDILLGTRTEQVQDLFLAPGYGRFSGVYLPALGAETLREGHPIDLGWQAALLIAAVLLYGARLMRRRMHAILLLAATAITLLVLPALLEYFLIFADIVPALVLLAIPIVALSGREMRARMRAQSNTNALTGLLNLNALRLEAIEPDRLLVVARVHNYAQVIATLPAEAEKVLVAQISARLTIGTPGLTLYQGDDGVFAWFTGEDSGALGDHLAALHALFRTPAVIFGTHVDLAVTFGVDAGRDRSIANRFGSALVAASEATLEGVKWKAFDATKLKDAAWKLSLLGQLDAAIDNGDLWVAYQPKLDLVTNRVVGAEALVRWTHREKGEISPMEFIPAAEQHNRIERLTMHVLERAIAAAAAISAQDAPFGMAVNLSVRLLEEEDLPARIMALLDRHGLPPELLTLEVTETAALTADRGLAVLAALRDHGIRISIDDYGTGLSTLEYLKKIPASEIKIDKSFIQSMTEGASDLLMVNSTIQLAHSLGHVVVAEGVESAVTLELLSEMNCDTAQGYLIGRPMTFLALSRRILEDQRRAAA